jgi:hypothetical protein
MYVRELSANNFKGEGIIMIGARGEILRRAEVGPPFLTIEWTSNLSPCREMGTVLQSFLGEQE